MADETVQRLIERVHREPVGVFELWQCEGLLFRAKRRKGCPVFIRHGVRGVLIGLSRLHHLVLVHIRESNVRQDGSDDPESKQQKDFEHDHSDRHLRSSRYHSASM